MMKHTATAVLRISDGYTIDVKHRELPLTAAAAILRSRRQHRYTAALRKGDTAVLTEHVITCPVCGFRRSATPRFFGEAVCKLSKRDIDRWADDQLGLWDDGFLQLHRLVIPDTFECPDCGTQSKLERNATGVRVTRDKRKLQLLCRGMAEGSPVSEALELNLRRGRVILTQYRIWENKKVIRDVTERPDLFKASHLYRLLGENIRLRKAVGRNLRALWGCPLPYKAEELTPERVVLLTRFLRYPRPFYDAIPFRDGTWRIEPHFRAIAKRLHDGKNFAAVVQTLQPICLFRSVRRLLLEKPGLTFYHAEVIKIFDLLGSDPAALCAFLRSHHSYYLLSQLAAYPGMALFLKDYLAVKGAAVLQRHFDRERAGVLRYYALEYWAMTPARRAQERRNWRCSDPEFVPGPGFSLPTPQQKGSDRTVDGFRFRYLRSSYELAQCGRILNNPLLAHSHEGTVVQITRGTHVLAALQLYGNHIVNIEAPGGFLNRETRAALDTFAREEGLYTDEDDPADDDFYCF